MAKQFLSGNEAFAYGVRLARPQVISAYPITPQTIVVEKLSEFVEDGSLNAEFIHVESEHSALSCAMGASSVGARAFTRGRSPRPPLRACSIWQSACPTRQAAGSRSL